MNRATNTYLDTGSVYNKKHSHPTHRPSALFGRSADSVRDAVTLKAFVWAVPVIGLTPNEKRVYSMREYSTCILLHKALHKAN